MSRWPHQRVGSLSRRLRLVGGLAWLGSATAPGLTVAQVPDQTPAPATETPTATSTAFPTPIPLTPRPALVGPITPTATFTRRPTGTATATRTPTVTATPGPECASVNLTLQLCHSNTTHFNTYASQPVTVVHTRGETVFSGAADPLSRVTLGTPSRCPATPCPLPCRP